MMSKLLLDDEPLVLLPSLAKAVGLNGSIILQQLHYWLQKSNHVYEGYKWIYNTYEDWKEQFPFWSESTIKRTIKALETEGLIISDNFNKKNFDKTKWYRINYKKLNQISSEYVNNRCGQNDLTIESDCSKEMVKMTTPIPEITTEITTDTNDDEERAREENQDDGDGVLTTDPSMEIEVSQSPEEIAFEIEQLYIQLRASGFFLSAKDLQSIYDIAKSGIELNDILAWLKESFTIFKPKFAGDKINSFAYCKTHILLRAYEKKSRYKAKENGGETSAKFSKNDGTDVPKQSGASKETRRLDEIAREQGLISDGEIRDVDVDF